MKLAWGKKVSSAFARKVILIANQIGCQPSDLMSCMAFESGETFSASVVNKVSGATGLIQFMRPTAKALGTTTADLAVMTAEHQLDYVASYFKPYHGRLKTIDDLYMAILWPLAVGKPSDYVLFDENVDATHKAYLQNKGLDADRNGQVTKAEAAAQPRAKLRKGLGDNYALETNSEDAAPAEPPADELPATDGIPIPQDRPTVPVAAHEQTKRIQRALAGVAPSKMNYYTGLVDGSYGGKLAGAIAGFLNDWDERDGDITPPKSNIDFENIADALEREIEYAVQEGFKRPVTEARANLDPEVVNEVAPQVATQKRGVFATIWAAIAAFFGGLYNIFSGYIANAWHWASGARDSLPDQLTEPSWIWSKLSAIPPGVWLMVGAGVFGFVAVGLIHAMKTTLHNVKTGKI